MRNFHHIKQKYRFGAQCRRPRAPRIVFKMYPTCFESYFKTKYDRANADRSILGRILVIRALKKSTFFIFMRNFHHQKKSHFGVLLALARVGNRL